MLRSGGKKKKLSCFAENVSLPLGEDKVCSSGGGSGGIGGAAAAQTNAIKVFFFDDYSTKTSRSN